MGCVEEEKKVRVVFVDVDTQKDFMNKDGALYVPGAEEIKDNLHKLTEFADRKDINVLATMDDHESDDPEFETFPPHCISGTDGAEKIDETDNVSAMYGKKTYNVFDEKLGSPEFASDLRALGPDRVILYGVATDICVAAAAKGIIDMDIPITLVEDACAGIDIDNIAKTKAMIEEAGGEIKTTEEVLNELL